MAHIGLSEVRWLGKGWLRQRVVTQYGTAGMRPNMNMESPSS